MRIYIASDHAGHEARLMLVAFLESSGHQVVDLGPKNATSVDYPDYARKVVEAILEDGEARGILICGTGIGMCMMANRYRGIRAAQCYSRQMAEMSRRHNNANILCLGGRLTPISEMREIVLTWLETEFEGGRHKRRIDKLDNL